MARASGRNRIFCDSDKVGLLIDMDTHRMGLYRNGEPVPSLTWDGLPNEGLYIVATPYHIGSLARIREGNVRGRLVENPVKMRTSVGESLTKHTQEAAGQVVLADQASLVGDSEDGAGASRVPDAKLDKPWTTVTMAMKLKRPLMEAKRRESLLGRHTNSEASTDEHGVKYVVDGTFTSGDLTLFNAGIGNVVLGEPDPVDPMAALKKEHTSMSDSNVSMQWL